MGQLKVRILRNHITLVCKMKTYLTLKSIPELSNLAGKDRGRLWRRNAWKAFKHLQAWLGIALFLIVVVIGFYFARQMHMRSPWRYIIISISYLFGYWLYLQLIIPKVRLYLKKESDVTNPNKD